MCVVDESVLEYPADASRIGAEFGVDALRQFGKHARQVLQRSRPRPVDVRSLVENDVDEGVPKIRESADGFHAGCAKHGRDDRIGDLVLHNVGAAIPPRVHDDLGVAQVGDGIERDVPHRPDPRGDGKTDQQKDEEAVTPGELDDPVNHGLRALPLCWGAWRRPRANRNR